MPRTGRPREGTYRTCKNCGTDFYTFQKSKKIFCSKKCSDQDRAKATYNAEFRIKKCARCGEWKADCCFAPHHRDGAILIGYQAYCRECGKDADKEFKATHGEHLREYRKKLYHLKPEKHREAARNISPERRKKKNIKQREYAKANPDKIRGWNRARFHRERAAGDISREDIERLNKLQRGRCACCRVKLGVKGYHLDHKVAITRGGTNAFDNLQLLCATCNTRKHNRDPIEFMQSQGFLL